MHQPTKTVVVLGASYAGKSKACHVSHIRMAHTTFPTQVTEQSTSSWKNFPRAGGSSSLKEIRTYYSLPISCALWIHPNVLGTSTVSGVALESLFAF